ncbi:unnamed protein product [Kluyveromyces dobzhanskii CBS 2104]|uniref:Ubiquitin carboxyl-terminal hydrolase n=1 Tax=Kluyveromyces dobzhanskii CBS 2104 TaxID=1427455 RepID=A0A0A8LA64_9SACH|nr:unnamed protein product [Kluyveromyces dobzhanskii CBS 2104]
MSSFKKWLGFQQSSSRKGSSSDKRSSSHSSSEIANPTSPAAVDESKKSRVPSEANSNGDSNKNVTEHSTVPITITTTNGSNIMSDFNGNSLHEEVFDYSGSYSSLDPLSNDLPYGIGAFKVFGYENFGNTCYCNSVLQCLYNLTEFRTEILKYPSRDERLRRRRKSSVVGAKPRVFTEASFGSQCASQASIGKHANGSHSPGGSNSLLVCGDGVPSSDSSRRGSLKFFKNPSDNNLPNSHTAGAKLKSAPNSASSLTPSNLAASDSSILSHDKLLRPVQTVVMPSDPLSEKLHENFAKIIVGRTQGTSFQPCNTEAQGSSNSSSPINSVVPQASSQQPYNTPSIEQRKKAALVKGPVINVDTSLADYLPKGAKPTLYSGLKDIFECIAENESTIGVVSPSNFVNILKQENVLFSSSMHQDAHEFLNYLLNELSDTLKKELDINDSEDQSSPTFIERLFKGSLFNSTKCFTCDTVTARDEPFLDFPVEIQEDEEIKIQDILSNYKHRELLTGANKFYCDKCCGLQEAERIVGLKSLPKNLAIHLKRFKYSEVRNCNAKLFNRIHYPLNLKVCSSFDNAVCKEYELNGIVIHMGGGPHHGHYVAICKNDLFGWLLFDDETVESINEDTVLKFIGDAHELTTAYVLIYKEANPSKSEPANFEKNIEHLLKENDHYRRKSSVNTNESALEGVPEEGTNEDSRRLKTKSKLFSFKRGTKV